jgi:hypothetical protein
VDGSTFPMREAWEDATSLCTDVVDAVEKG